MTLDIFEHYPQLRDARQPPILPMVYGSFNYSPGDVFAELVSKAEAGTFRLRAPAESIEGLVGPFRATGTCLEPLFKSGDYYWIDPGLEPADGDFVIVLLDPAELAGIIERGRDDPQWVATYGPNPGPIVTKLLKRCGNEWWLQDNETAFALTVRLRDSRNNRILGVIRKVSRDYRVLFEGAPIAHAIGANATSQIVSAVLSGNSTFDVHVAPVSADVLTITIVSTGSPVGIDVTSTLSAGLEHTSFSSPMNAIVTRDGTQIGTAQFDVYDWVVNTQATGTVIAEWSTQLTLTVMDAPSAGSHTYALHLNAAQAGTGSGTVIADVIFTNTVIKVREYKR